MAKTYVFISGDNHRRFATSIPFLEVLAGSVVHRLKERGFEKVISAHTPLADTGGLLRNQNLKVIVSEHQLGAPIAAIADGSDVRIEDIRVRPRITPLNGVGHIGIAIAGYPNTGKSWIGRMITELMHGHFFVPKEWVTEEHLLGTFGWPGKSDDFLHEGMERLLKELEVEVRIIPALRGDYLYNTFKLSN